jgi:DNA-binding CsgD family transcriptional regulator
MLHSSRVPAPFALPQPGLFAPSPSPLLPPLQLPSRAVPPEAIHPTPTLGRLTPRELEIFRWIAACKSDWQIGHILMISPKTVNYHVEKAKRKLNVGTRARALMILAATKVLDGSVVH